MMSDAKRVALSKKMSWMLRHNPTAAGISLSSQGWVELGEVAKALGGASVAEVVFVAQQCSKQRFEIQGELIRAAQGHSSTLGVETGVVATPPAVLFHGTARKFLEGIWEQGLLPMSRADVHLSPNRETALAVAARRTAPVLLEVNTALCAQSGVVFKLSSNGVWLCSFVPPQALTLVN